MASGDMLENHRLERVETYDVVDKFPRHVGRNAKNPPEACGGKAHLQLLATDQRATGWALSHVSEEEIKPLIGQRLSELFDPEKGTAEHAFCLDLAGNILNKPVYELLGGMGRKTVPIYSGSIYFDDLEPPNSPRGVQGIIESCRQDYELGYRAFKLKIGRGVQVDGTRGGLQTRHRGRPRCKKAFPRLQNPPRRKQ